MDNPLSILFMLCWNKKPNLSAKRTRAFYIILNIVLGMGMEMGIYRMERMLEQNSFYTLLFYQKAH